jgi:hypothetical protein
MKYLERSKRLTEREDKAIEQEGKFFTNDDIIDFVLTIPSGKNTFVCGPVNFTANVEINGVLNII